MIAPLLSYVPLLALTLGLELGVVLLLARRDLRSRAATACLALNLFTHPTVTLLSWRWHAEPLSLELLAFLCEWVGYARLLGIGALPALGYAAAANLVSAAAGFALWTIRMG